MGQLLGPKPLCQFLRGITVINVVIPVLVWLISFTNPLTINVKN